MRADVVYRNAVVLTMDPGRPRATAFATLGDRLVAVGGDEVAGLAAARTVDLGGRCVLPGFHDAHNHMAWYGMNRTELDLGPGRVRDVGDVYAQVAREAARRRPGEWIIGAGYDQNRMAGGHPTAARLDRAAPHHPVWLKHTSGHMCVVNSRVLDLSGATAAPDPAGGRIVRDASGAPTGLLQERAQELVRGLLFPFAAGQLVRALGAAARDYAAEGITSVQEAGIGGGWIGHSGVEVAAYQQAGDEDLLLQRVTLMVASDVLHPLDAHRDDPYRSGIDLGIRTGFGDDRLRLGAVKVFSDGSLLGRTSAMCCDFADDPGNRGFLQDDEDRLTETIIAAHRAGWQVATHAIGDRAVDVVLAAYAEAQRRHPRSDPRHRIEHCAVTSPEQVERIVRLGVIPVPQGSLVREAGDGMADALGPERTGWCYRVRSFTDRGVEVPGSSDRPVVTGAPLANVHTLVTRRTLGGRVLAPEERVDVETALRGYTYGSARAAHAERSRGMLGEGYLADFTVLERDPTRVPLDDLPHLTVLATVVGGRAVHDLGILT
ncbi:amidohydrolase [Streptomyces sp. ACA25]|uniref:amidohydrolase n=1 Tax=Streptomyces sp. ACA25 TaxID=3022596 RepID=UPI002307A7B2|nr:amidohydrolase [Streptomyces sp. ACA25]MDB1087137.1 amidohydrolase [Streptomyces sp. ACA25]